MAGLLSLGVTHADVLTQLCATGGRSGSGVTLLHRAVRSGNEAMVEVRQPQSNFAKYTLTEDSRDLKVRK